MEFGIFSNGFRPHTTAAQTYDEDLAEIVLADQLGFRDAYISEHHGEPPYIGRVDTLPVPELLMCKAASLTTQIRMGAAVRVIHLQHPLDVAVQAATTDQLLKGRYIFGYGTGFPSPLFSVERGLTHEDRHARLSESLDLILQCWSKVEPFDWDGTHWKGKGIVSLPKPYSTPHMPIATATDTDAMIKIAAERGYILLSAQLEPPTRIRKKSQVYSRYALAAGRERPLESITVARLVYISDSKQQALDDLRAAVAFEVGVQAERGFLSMLKDAYNVELLPNKTAIDQLVEAGLYLVGDPDSVTKNLKAFYEDAGGFGTLLIVTGKDWASREKRANSMRMFMEFVAPQLRSLVPTRS